MASTTEIRLEQQKKAEQARHRKRRNDPAAEGLDEVLLGAHEIGQIQGHGHLDEFHGLHGKWPHGYPALGAVDGGRQGRKRDQQQQQRQKERRILQFVQPVARQQGSHPQGQQSYAGKGDLPFEKVVFVPVLDFRHDAAGRQHHDEADGKNDHRKREQPPVKAAGQRFFRHAGKHRGCLALAKIVLLHARSPTMRLKSSPRRA